MRSSVIFSTIYLVVAGALASAAPQQAAAAPAGVQDAAQAQVANKTLVTRYCVTCHSDRLKTAGLSLEKIDFNNLTAGAEVWEKVIRKVHTGSMPPLGMPRPDKTTIDGFAGWLETSIDKVALAKPNPGRATLHRLNRTEYANAIKDILGLDIDATALLPNDDESYGFDNIADVLKTSPALLERYMSASWNISRLAVGNPNISADTATYRAKPDLSQDDHIEGLPLGTRGGMMMKHNFPLDGDYVFRVRLWRPTTDIIRGLMYPNTVEVSVDGVRVGLATLGGKADEKASEENSGTSATDLDNRLTFRVPVKAGPRTVVATFLAKPKSADDDVLQPFIRTAIDPVGYQGQPMLDRLSINGPLDARGSGDTPSRRKIFVCRPGKGMDEVTCAKKIIGNLARRAYRRPVTEKDSEQLLTFFQKGKNEGKTFEPESDPGVLSVRRIYSYYKTHDIKTVVMGASFRSAAEIEALAGCDRLTISPNYLEELSKDQGVLTRRLSPGRDVNAPARMSLDEKSFRFLLNEDAMATEKLAEGIRLFAKDLRTLRDMVSKRLAQAE